MEEENGLLVQQQQMQMRGDLEKVALEHDEAIDAMLLLSSHVKSVNGLESTDFIKATSRQKSGIELAKAIYIELIKAMAIANDRLNSDQETELKKQLEAMSFEALKLKISMIPQVSQPLSPDQDFGNRGGDENPLINLLKSKQYKR